MTRLNSHLGRGEGGQGQGRREEREGGGWRRKIGRIEPLERPDGMEVRNEKRREKETRGQETRGEGTRDLVNCIYVLNSCENSFD